MTTNLTLAAASWSVERNGKMHFKQDQLFHLHRLSLMVIKLTGHRLHFRTRIELEQFLAFAETIEAEQVQRQLDSVRRVLPFHWNHHLLTG